MKKRKVVYTLEIKDKESEHLLYSYDVVYTCTEAEEKSVMFQAALIEQEKKIMEQALSTRWSKKK